MKWNDLQILLDWIFFFFFFFCEINCKWLLIVSIKLTTKESICCWERKFPAMRKVWWNVGLSVNLSLLSLSFLYGIYAVKSQHNSYWRKRSVVIIPCLMKKASPDSGIWQIFACHIRNPGTDFCFWIPDSCTLKYGKQLKESGIHLTTGFRNPSSTDIVRNPVLGI